MVVIIMLLIIIIIVSDHSRFVLVSYHTPLS